jgi:hypothetical protein
MRERRRLGDIYEVALGDGRAAFFQHICNDSTQLDSAVIRVFNPIPLADEKPDLPKLLESGVRFQAHVFIKAGYVLNIWRKIGHLSPPDDTDIVFRSSRDYGVNPVEVSYDWEVWRTNQPRTRVGRLPEKFFDAEIGVVKAPQEIVKRILTGSYSSYMGFE